MKKMELPEMKFVELAAEDVIATSDGTSDGCTDFCESDCKDVGFGECYSVCEPYGYGQGTYYCREE